MNEPPRISESEWRVMCVLWSKGAATANEVVDELADQTNWNPRTVKTLITRLMKKRAIKYIKEGRMYRYSPVIDQSHYIQKERHSFVQRIYGGAYTPMLCNFIEDAELSPNEIEQLKQLLDRKSDKQRFNP